MKKLLFFVFMIMIGTLKASDLDEEVLKAASSKADLFTSCDCSWALQENLNRLQKERNLSSKDVLISSSYQKGGGYVYLDYGVNADARRIIASWSAEEKQRYLADAVRFAPIKKELGLK